MCRNLTVLYLYDNQLTHIHNLGFASNLTHLYMQNNNITHIDNLSNLQNLSKLWVDEFDWLWSFAVKIVERLWWVWTCVWFSCSVGIWVETGLQWWRA